MAATGVLELVARMRRESFSRNRNFDAFANASEDASRARRVWRYLRSLERELAAIRGRIGAGVTLKVEPSGAGGTRITIEVPAVRARRVAVLSAAEYALLREHAEARAALDSI